MEGGAKSEHRKGPIQSIELSRGTLELRGFLTYVSNGPSSGSGGRWGEADETAKNRPVTAATYHSRLRTFFAWLLEEGYVDENPMANLKPPVHRADQIQPFTEEQVASRLSCERQSKHARRDEAILLLLLHTGMRASELCDLRLKTWMHHSKRQPSSGKATSTARSIFPERLARRSGSKFGLRKENPQTLYSAPSGATR
jgi:site-specific recombinase XerD